MRPPIEMHVFNKYIFGTEIFFTIIVILSAILIYYKTKDLYKLSTHKGIKYFRKGFLFIGFGHILMLLNIIFRSQIFSSEFIDIKLFFGISTLFSLIGISFLFSSMYSKYIKEYYIYLFSPIVFSLAFFFQTKSFILIYSTILIISLGIVSFYKYKKSRKKHLSQIYVIYILVFSTWLISLLTRVFTNLPFSGKTINIITNGLISLYILYLVIKKLK